MEFWPSNRASFILGWPGWIIQGGEGGPAIGGAEEENGFLQGVNSLMTVSLKIRVRQNIPHGVSTMQKSLRHVRLLLSHFKQSYWQMRSAVILLDGNYTYRLVYTIKCQFFMFIMVFLLIERNEGSFLTRGLDFWASIYHYFKASLAGGCTF